MGNSCSSGQGHKDKDEVSQHSEESPSYRVTKPSVDITPNVEETKERGQLEPAAAATQKATAKVPRPIGTASVSDSISLSSPVACASPRELEAPELPAGLAELPEEKRNTLLGRFPLRPRKRRALLVYVCAADSQDCLSEKGALHCGAMPALRARARRVGWRAHATDLHWRSPLEQQRDHRFPVLCVAELARQSELGSVVPVLFLNAGLGTPLLPHTLEYADFQAALEAATDENDKALLNKWYTLDSSSSPSCYRLVRGAPARWRREMARALNVLVRTLPQEACDAYLTTVVEQEVQHTVVICAEAARRCVWVHRGAAAGAAAGGAGAGAGTPGAAGEGAVLEPGDAELARRRTALHAHLKQHLSERNIIRWSVRGRAPSEEEYAATVRAALAARLDAALDTARAAPHAPPLTHDLFEEIDEHLSFCERAAQCTANREITLTELKTYINTSTSVPLALIGGAGSGKATLAARAAAAVDRTLLVRFVGLTPHSSSSHLLLKSLVDQCHMLLTGTLYRGRNDVPTLSTVFPKLLAALGRVRPVLVAIVGVDALRGARWLPSKLPANVNMIVTVTEEADEPSSSAIMAVLSSEDGPRVVRAPPVGPDEAKAVLSASAATYCKTGAPPPPPDAEVAVTKCTLPLYAKVLAWQISLSTETFAEQSDSTPPELKVCDDLESQLAQLFLATEQALGADKVQACLSLLTAARRGLDDGEMIDLLAHDELFQSEETYLPWAPAALFWPQLAVILQPWLVCTPCGTAHWRDPAVASAARDRYLANQDKAHRTLAEYFQGDWFEENDPKMTGRLISQDNKFSDDFYNTRKLDELPYHHYHLSKSDPSSFANRPYFTDHTWIHDKIAATDCTHFLEDIALIHLDPLPEHIEILKDLLETHSYALDYDHRQFYGLLRVTLEKRQRSGVEIKTDVCKSWLDVAFNPPIPTLVPLNADFHNLMEESEKRDVLEETSGVKYFDAIVKLGKGTRFVATISTEREEICVWDAHKCRCVRVVRGVPRPGALCGVRGARALVLCGRELRLYDLDTGEFIVALKGVMNQKMPYYGLHDEKHIVALARNRMYVNLMNIETGDCVTTFKAGEDRFLNSLLVSGDGRILVCGDETQKPFPLLVWSLTSRKLLYDLRIPHHDFVTSKAAITHEGSYVCVVARELDEPSPNFIVVYDLQSGTLFKKWKPGSDTTALTISSEDGCVVSALADNTILVWDLVTGNCRYVLRGHASAARSVRRGARPALLSHAPRDRALRLWNLATGKLTSVYTPPEKVTSYEVLGGGSHIVLALENYKELVTLRLEGAVPDSVTQGQDEEEETFGNPENDGKIFDLKESDNC